jgi:hypothetical protein
VQKEETPKLAVGDESHEEALVMAGMKDMF